MSVQECTQLYRENIFYQTGFCLECLGGFPFSSLPSQGVVFSVIPWGEKTSHAMTQQVLLQ